MFPEVTITYDMTALFASVEGPRKQVRFAASKTLNDVAEAVKKQMPREISDGRFTLRREWILKGFRTRHASRSNLVATIFHLDGYTKLQEEGGTKRAISGQHLAVAGRTLRDAYRTASSPARIRKADWPSEVLNRDATTSPRGYFPRRARNGGRTRGMSGKRAFITTLKKGALAVVERRPGTEAGNPRTRGYGRTFTALYGRRAGRRKAPKLRRLKRALLVRHILTPTGRVQPKLSLRQKARLLLWQMAMERFAINFAAAMKDAK